MSIAKVIEVTAQSEKGFEDAIREGIARTGETLSNVQSAWIKDQDVQIQEGKITAYRVTMKVTFVVSS
ncbi:MAG: dodecin domain-containing protein [Candidatus Eisenbacteria bacterium]|nr:dodecin domain-containing protein [Candidatus Eisenbacteria bacterium]